MRPPRTVPYRIATPGCPGGRRKRAGKDRLAVHANTGQYGEQRQVFFHSFTVRFEFIMCLSLLFRFSASSVFLLLLFSPFPP